MCADMHNHTGIHKSLWKVIVFYTTFSRKITMTFNASSHSSFRKLKHPNFTSTKLHTQLDASNKNRDPICWEMGQYHLLSLSYKESLYLFWGPGQSVTWQATLSRKVMIISHNPGALGNCLFSLQLESVRRICVVLFGFDRLCIGLFPI